MGGLLILIVFLLAIGALNWFMLQELGHLDGKKHDDWFEKVHDWVVKICDTILSVGGGQKPKR